MPIPSGVQKIVVFAKESTTGVKSTATGKQVRRVSMELSAARQSFVSTEITTTAQTQDMRLGTKKISGSLKGQLAPAEYEDFFSSLLRGTWAAGASVSGTNVSAVSANKFAIASGSFLTAGFCVGDLIQVSGFSVSGNNGYFMVTGVTANQLTVDGAVTAEAAGPTVTIKVPGKKLTVPTLAANRSDYSYTVEQWYSGGVNVSEIATGVKIAKASLNVQPNAMVTVDFDLKGLDMVSQAAQQYTTASAPTVTGLLSGTSGTLYVNGSPIATVTGLSLNVDGNLQEGDAAFSDVSSGIFQGRVAVTGQFTAYFTDNTLWTQFMNETEVSLVFRLDGAAAGQSMVFKLPRIKLGGSSKDDKETGGIIQTVPFTALLAAGGSGVENTTIAIQDTTL